MSLGYCIKQGACKAAVIVCAPDKEVAHWCSRGLRKHNSVRRAGALCALLLLLLLLWLPWMLALKQSLACVSVVGTPTVVGAPHGP